MRKTGSWTRWVYDLELYELVGVLVSMAMVIVFFAFAKRLDRIIGVNHGQWILLNDVMGMYQNWVPWVFTCLLTALLVTLVMLKRDSSRNRQKLADLVRVLIGFCLMMAIYKTVNYYIAVFNPFDRDMVLGHIDRLLFFGKMPSQWLEPVVCRPLTWLLSFCYLSWFVLVYGTILLMMQHSRYSTAEYVFTTLLTFYIGYITYTLVPAIGPLFTVPFDRDIGGLTFMFASHQQLIARDCFPSLHTAISLIMLTSVARHRRRWVWLYAPSVVLIIFSTVYLRFHYGIDLIAGVALAGVTTQVCPMMVTAWERVRIRQQVSVRGNRMTGSVIADGSSQNVTA